MARPSESASSAWAPSIPRRRRRRVFLLGGGCRRSVGGHHHQHSDAKGRKLPSISGAETALSAQGLFRLQWSNRIRIGLLAVLDGDKDAGSRYSLLIAQRNRPVVIFRAIDAANESLHGEPSTAVRVLYASADCEPLYTQGAISPRRRSVDPWRTPTPIVEFAL